MASKTQLGLFNQILNLPEVIIKNYQFIDSFGWLLIVEKKEKKSTCPNCGCLSERLHQNYRDLVRDLSIMEQDVYLRVNRRQFKCDRCQKPFYEEFDFVKKTRVYTERFGEKIIAEVVESDLKNVAQRNGLSENEVKTILKEKFSEFKTYKSRKFKQLGIDKIAWVKEKKKYANTKYSKYCVLKNKKDLNN